MKIKSRFILNLSFLSGIINAVSSVPVAQATLPVTNLFNGMRHKCCRITPTNNTATITITLQNTTNISAVGIGGFNFSVTATMQCVVKDNSGATVYDSGVGDVYSNTDQAALPWYSRTKAWFFNTIAAKMIIITLNDTVTPYNLSHIVFSLDYSASINPDWSLSWDWIDVSIQQRTQGGSLLANPAYGHRKLQITLSNLPNFDYYNLGALIQNQGKSLLLSLFPGDGSRKEVDMQMICRLVSKDGINLDGYNSNSIRSFIFEEI